MARAIFNREAELTALAVIALVGVAVARFVFDEAHGVMLLGTIPIVLLGVMHGLRAGLAAALFSAVLFEIWAIDSGRSGVVEMIDVPLTFFVLGGLSGAYARGVLGDFHLRHAARRSELRSGVRRGELVLHYQPMIDAKTGRPSGVEARRHPV